MNLGVHTVKADQPTASLGTHRRVGYDFLIGFAPPTIAIVLVLGDVMACGLHSLPHTTRNLFIYVEDSFRGFQKVILLGNRMQF
ncbi:hypothetical protein DPMN_016151 [Dreissena polymorpha]|uniref:Uncharacterized protein n=1 Tax=Dreissena polymorpha TaxID=45954 RepID=A0A9D4NE79_DREPO|nr:hypothetical protein DPMN_016151 [Dreissena polymorpha]